jgi:hypothetical protein
MSQLDRPVMLLKKNSVASYHILSSIESEGTLCYLSRLVYGLLTFYSGVFPPPAKFPKKMGITQTPTSKWGGLNTFQ